MKYNFLNENIEQKNLLNLNNNSINQILLETNKSQAEEIYNFYKSEDSTLFISGFLGTGKSELVSYSKNFLSNDVIVLNYNCFETTIIDDILLDFFDEFKKLQAQKIIDDPKIKTENFTQKINSYFTAIDKPFLIVLKTFESIQDANKTQIIDFLNHIQSFNKIKTIVLTRTFEASGLPETLKYQRIMTTPLSKTSVEKHLKNLKEKFTNIDLDLFYKQTRGYFFYIELSLCIIKHKNIDLKTFMANFQKSFGSFSEFLEKESLDIIPATGVRFFWFLCLLRHGATPDLLKKLNLYDETNIKFLINHMMLIEENSLLFVPEYFREQVDKTIPANVALKLHQFIIELYDSQLPLKPLERNVLVSRQTMRSEIEYHTLFLPKKPKLHDYNSIGYVSYSKESSYDLTSETKAEEAAKKQQEQQIQPQQIQKILSQPIKIPKDIDISKMKDFEKSLKDLPFKLSEQELALLDTSNTSDTSSTIPPVTLQTQEQEPLIINLEQSAQEIPKPQIQQQPILEKSNETLEFELLLKDAKIAEDEFNFKKMLILLEHALKITGAKDYELLLPTIYTKMAMTYQKLSDWESALKYYKLTDEIYLKENNIVKSNYIKLNIANAYYETYKPNEAKDIYNKILSNTSNPVILNVKTYLGLANVEDSLANIDKANEYYERALAISNPSMDVATLSELYFKYALVMDDKHNTIAAIDYYNKCINISNDSKTNKFLSSAYSNLATIHYEQNKLSLAVKSYLKAFEIDSSLNNFDGMYYSASKLAQITQRKFPDKALFYFKKSQECAQKLNDIFYMASSSLALGDFYYNQKRNEDALRQYLWALDLVKNDFSKDNINKIKIRINDIKFRMGEDRFKELEKEFTYE